MTDINRVKKDNEEEIDKKIREALHKTEDTVFPPIPEVKGIALDDDGKPYVVI